jgi:hypothetical protein
MEVDEAFEDLWALQTEEKHEKLVGLTTVSAVNQMRSIVGFRHGQRTVTTAPTICVDGKSISVGTGPAGDTLTASFIATVLFVAFGGTSEQSKGLTARAKKWEDFVRIFTCGTDPGYPFYQADVG